MMDNPQDRMVDDLRSAQAKAFGVVAAKSHTTPVAKADQTGSCRKKKSCPPFAFQTPF